MIDSIIFKAPEFPGSIAAFWSSYFQLWRSISISEIISRLNGRDVAEVEAEANAVPLDAETQLDVSRGRRGAEAST